VETINVEDLRKEEREGRVTYNVITLENLGGSYIGIRTVFDD
jgi:hypothetical protein